MNILKTTGQISSKYQINNLTYFFCVHPCLVKAYIHKNTARLIQKIVLRKKPYLITTDSFCLVKILWTGTGRVWKQNSPPDCWEVFFPLFSGCATEQRQVQDTATELDKSDFLAIVASIGTSPLYLSVQAEVVDKNRTGNYSLRIVQRQIIVLLLDLFYPSFFFE